MALARAAGDTGSLSGVCRNEAKTGNERKELESKNKTTAEDREVRREREREDEQHLPAFSLSPSLSLPRDLIRAQGQMCVKEGDARKGEARHGDQRRRPLESSEKNRLRAKQ